MRNLLLTAVSLWLVMICVDPAQAQEPAKVWGDAKATAALTTEPELQPMKIRKGLTIKQRREMGLTFRNVRKTLAAMQADGEITADMDSATIAAAVANRLVADNPQAFGDPELDWDAILEFLEKLIPLILRLIELFSDVGTPPVDWQYVDAAPLVYGSAA